MQSKNLEEEKEMKKRIKSITVMLSIIIALLMSVPVMALAASDWYYGYDPDLMQNYSTYYHSDIDHAAGMTKNGVVYSTGRVSPGYWADLRLSYTGPYLVTYQKYDY